MVQEQSGKNPGVQETNSSPDILVFQNWLREFLGQHKSDIVVEIGSDVQLKLAGYMSPYCGVIHSVNFPDEHKRMKGWHKMHDAMGMSNITLTSGDALHLSDLIAHADVIVVHNVLLDGNNGEDSKLMWQYRRGEKECTDEEWQELWHRFDQVEVDGFREFLKVANPGYIIRFARHEEDDRFMNVLANELGLNPVKIVKRQFLYDAEDEEPWDAYIIDNT